MDKLTHYRELIERILREHAAIPYAYDNVQTYVVLDQQSDHYLLVDIGWDADGTRIHDIMAHVDIVDGKFKIQYDGLEDGIDTELVEAGVPRSDIVEAYHATHIASHLEGQTS